MRFGPPTPRESGMMLLGCGSSGAGGVTPPLAGLTANLLTATSISRQMVPGYSGPLIRVINSGTSTQTDIGFIASTGLLDETALAAARTGTEVLYLHTIYDQSGNARHRVLSAETGTAHRLRVVGSTGTIEKLEGKVCGTSVADLSGPYTEASTFASPAGTTITAYAVHQLTSTSSDNRVLSVAVGGGNDYTDPAAAVILQRSAGTAAVIIYRGGSSGTTLSQPYSERAVVTSRFTGSGGVLESIYGQATHASTATFGYTRTLVGGQNSTIGVFRNGDKFCEAAFWSSDVGESAMRTLRQSTYYSYTAAPTKWTGKKIIWTGTSIPSTNPGAGSYPAQIAEALSACIVNEASGSSRLTWNAATLGSYPSAEGRSLSVTLAELSANSLTAFNDESYETKLINKYPDWIVLDHSVNDVYEPVGTSIDAKAKFVGALQFIYDTTKANRPGVKFLLLSPYSKHVAADAFHNEIDAIVAGMASWATGKSDVVYIDVMTALNLSLGDMATYASDGTHPNTAGVTLIKNYLAAQMLLLTP